MNSKDAYESWHERQEVDSESDSPWHRLVKAHLCDSDGLREKRILEIGCGRGGLAFWLANQRGAEAEITAADFAFTAVQKGRHFERQTTTSRIRWAVSDIQSIPHRDASFDLVISCETVEHVAEPRKALYELARVLKPGGRLLLTTPNYLGTLGLYRIYLSLSGRVFTEEGQPINNFLLLPVTVAWVKASGLRIKAIDAMGHYLPFPRRPPLQLSFLNRPKIVMKWLALHSLIVAEKP